jgi:hypothetical protein
MQSKKGRWTRCLRIAVYSQKLCGWPTQPERLQLGLKLGQYVVQADSLEILCEPHVIVILSNKERKHFYYNKHTINIQINQSDASIPQIYCSSFKYSSTCFGHPHAHYQELINCSL